MKSLFAAALIKIAISIGLYFLAFLPMNYLPDFIRNNEYSSFFYLPTGVKVMCVLVFDIWGAIGVAMGVFVRQLIQHPELGLIFPLSVGLENAIILFGVVRLAMKALGVGRDIENLTYIKIVLIAFFVSAAHGLSYTFVLVKFGLVSSESYLRESLVTTISGFFGTMATVLLLTLIFKNSSWLQRQMRVIEND